MKSADNIRPTVPRHSIAVRVQHWTIALSGLALLFSGFGQFPLYKRYMVDRLPGMAWVSDFPLQFSIHIVAAIFFLAAVVFHAVYHLRRRETALLPQRGDMSESWQIIKATFGRGEEPPSDKFLAEQRLTYALFAVTVLLLSVSGIIKVFKDLPGASISPSLHLWSTMLHNAGTMVFLFLLVAHLAAFAVRANRPLFRSMFTGRVDAGYAAERHPLWRPFSLPARVEKSENSSAT
jgi:formate dehydrogenase gamma subunit